jgi:hypothetical protein
MVPRWKALLTVPRIGHVEPAAPSRRRLTLFAMAPVVIGLGAVAFRTLGGASDTSNVGVVSALLLAGAFAYGAIRWSQMHLLALSAVALLFAVWTHRAAATASAAPWLLVVLGIGLGLSGTVRLLRFLATHQVRAEGDVE